MLEIKKINKSYKTGTFVQHALNDISLKFRKNEFVSILGPSGSGKTTLLNIIGGLDHYDAGDLIINNKSTKKFSDKDWDYYRNSCVGFIFQSYNLIGHLSVAENVSMSLTLSNVKDKKKLALDALERVGLKDHAYKKPNQLSGGQMQRVAIARALVNDPDIILADEPTGALDSKTSVQIMELIKEIAKDKLVIMVTHNDDLAKKYSSRIIELKDGHLINDSNPVLDDEDTNDVVIRKTKMSFFTALKLSFKNIITKTGRTVLTSFAASIGIIGIALVLSLSNGFDKQINEFEEKTLVNLPIYINKQYQDLSSMTMDAFTGATDKYKTYPDDEIVHGYDYTSSFKVHTNNITSEYIDYLDKMNTDWTLSVSYERNVNLNSVVKSENEIKAVDLSSLIGMLDKDSSSLKNIFYPYYFDVIKGEIPQQKEGLVLVVDSQNKVSDTLLKYLGITGSDISFDELMNKEIRVVMNDDFYTSVNGFYVVNSDLSSAYNSSKTVTLKIMAIVRGKEDQELATSTAGGLYYTPELLDYIISCNKNSSIVKDQMKYNYNVLTGDTFASSKGMYSTGITKDDFLDYLGADVLPSSISISPKDFNSKELITDYLDKYNDGKTDDDKIFYSDQAKTITSLSGSIMDAITIVLVAFSAISLVVSSIMIGIITYISVLERTKEIGILRSLGARKKDITRVFNAETFIIGVFSGVLGILITEILIIPVNQILYSLTDLKNIAVLNPIHAIILVTISVILTLIGGFIPAKMASKKDPVEALRTE